jgi:hypothetical protein
MTQLWVLVGKSVRKRFLWSLPTLKVLCVGTRAKERGIGKEFTGCKAVFDNFYR